MNTTTSGEVLVTTEPDPAPIEGSRFELRMSRPYRDWLDRVASAERCGVADLIERALAEWSRRAGHETPPGRRRPGPGEIR